METVVATKTLCYLDTNQFVLFHQKVNGISQRNTGVDMFLNNRSITNGVSFSVRP